MADRDTSIYRFERIQNELYRLLYGREEIPARWKVTKLPCWFLLYLVHYQFCIAYVNGNLGMSVGSLFVRKYFDGQSKQDVRSQLSLLSKYEN